MSGGRFAEQEALLKAELDQWVMRSRAAIADSGEPATALALAHHFAERYDYPWYPEVPMAAPNARALLLLLGAAVAELLKHEGPLP